VRKRLIITCLLLIMVMVLSGCDVNARNLIDSSKDNKQELIKVEIVFTDGQKLVTHVKELGVDSNARVFVGGSSTNYFYDARGNVIGAFNYQRVLYMRVLPKSAGNSREG
jgi:hypothetical protein